MYKRINITLTEETLARADAFASQERYTRSGLIAAALESFVAEKGAGTVGTGGASIASEPRAAYSATAAPVPGLSLERVGLLLRAFFSARGDVEAAWVFGSLARGTAGPVSDVDVAVLPAAGLDADGVWELRLDLMSRLPGVLSATEVDVVALPDAGVMLGFEVASEGVQVFGESRRSADEAIITAISAYWEYEGVREAARVALGERMRAFGSSE